MVSSVFTTTVNMHFSQSSILLRAPLISLNIFTQNFGTARACFSLNEIYQAAQLEVLEYHFSFLSFKNLTHTRMASNKTVFKIRKYFIRENYGAIFTAKKKVNLSRYRPGRALGVPEG
jgi:hypothetical protein